MVQTVAPDPKPVVYYSRYVLVDGTWVPRLRGAQDLILVGKHAVNAV